MVLKNFTKEETMNLDDDLFSVYLEEVDSELNKQSDRAITLVCCSILEELLKEKIKMNLVSDDGTRKLFDGNGPFGTVQNRTLSAYYMGLITRNQRKNLEYMQRVRNKFAHQVVGLSFEHPQIKDMCSHLEIPTNMYMPRNLMYKKTAMEDGIKVEKEFDIDTNPYENTVSTKEKYILMFNYLYDVLRPFENNTTTPAEEILPHERIQRIINFYEEKVDLLKNETQDSKTKEMIEEIELFISNNTENINQIIEVLKKSYK